MSLVRLSDAKFSSQPPRDRPRARRRRAPRAKVSAGVYLPVPRTQGSNTSLARRAPRRRIPRGPRPPMSKLDECTMDYIKMMADPFVRDVVCCPLGNGRRSFRFTTWSRGTMQTGTTGQGFVTLNPYRGWRAAAGTSKCTLASSVGNSATLLNAFTAPGDIQPSSPITVVIGTGIEVRVVAAGLRVMCTGVPQVTQGQVFAGRLAGNVDGGTLTGALLEADARFSCVSAFSTLTDPVVVVWAPEAVGDDGFYTGSETNYPTGGAGYGPLIVWVNGGASMPFMVDYFCHYEYISSATAAQSSAGMADSRATTFVEAIADSVGATSKTFFNALAVQLSQSASSVAPHLAQALSLWARGRSRTTLALE